MTTQSTPPQGATHRNVLGDGWAKLTDGKQYAWTELAGWVDVSLAGGFRAEFVQAMVRIPNAPRFDEPQNVARIWWDGEGLPPIGVACQVTPHNDVWGFSTLETRPCSVIAYHADFAWIDLGTPGVPVATRIDKVDFTPTRTPEQIAADERLHKIRNACTDIAEKVEPWNNDIDCSQAMRATIEAMIDAGYRKQVKP